MSAGAVVRSCAAACVLLVAAVSAVRAQPVPAGEGRFLIGGALSMAGGTALGTETASLTPNLGQPAFTLFTATAETGRLSGGELRAGVRIGAGLVVSVVAAGGFLPVRIGIAGDAESPSHPSFTGERLSQWTVEGRVDWVVPALHFAGGRGRPFAMVSAGALRQWHEERTVHDSGHLIQAGGGVLLTLANRPRALVSRWSLLAELRIARLSGGYYWSEHSRTAPALSAGLLTTWGRP
jgi:hypothetical protein